jgi:hypothetical protein
MGQECLSCRYDDVNIARISPAVAGTFNAPLPALAGSQQEKPMADRADPVGFNEDFFKDGDVALHALVERNHGRPLMWFGLFEGDDLEMLRHGPVLYGFDRELPWQPKAA